MLAAARDTVPVVPRSRAVIAPHAGYVYSGASAACAYAVLGQTEAEIKTVVLFGPSHRVAFEGLALPDVDAFETPLGLLHLDRELCETIPRFSEVLVSDRAHAAEHSLEVQLPFVQIALGNPTIVPVVVSGSVFDQVARVIDGLWERDSIAFVISSDLSHFLNDAKARLLDLETASAIEALEGNAIDHEQACGRVPIQGLLAVAARRRLRVTRLALYNSGETAGDRDRVVGYGSWAFSEALQ